MKKYIILLLALFFFSDSFAQHKAVKRIGISNPAPGNIENILFLIQQGYIKVDSLQLIGIFHESQKELIDNRQYDLSSLAFHPIQVVKNGFLDFEKAGYSPEVASVHHQAVKELGKNYKVSATSTDKKVVEAIENDKYKNVYGIQFHIDIPMIYRDGAEFKTSPNDVQRIDARSRQFYIQIWKDFSERLNNQK